MSQRKFTLDFSDYDGSKTYTPAASFAVKFPKALKRLKEQVELPGIQTLISNRVAQGKSKFFIQHKITTTTEGKKFFQNYETWNIQTLMQKVKMKPHEIIGLKNRLDEDCVGTTDRPYDDPLCYTAHAGVQVVDAGSTPSATAAAGTTTPTITSASLRSASATTTTAGAAAASATQNIVNQTQYRPTDFLAQLRLYQEQLYVWLRVNIQNYLDPVAKNVLVTHMEAKQEEIIRNDNTLTEANFFNRSKRITWESIKDYILSKICKEPLEGNTFSKLRTTLRKDKSTISTWVSDVINIKRDIDAMGSEWAAVVPKEAMYAATRWATEVERNLIEQLIVKQGKQGTYPTFDDLAEKMNIIEFRKLCTALDPKKTPKNFTQFKSTRALKESLITYGEAQLMATNQTKELRSRIVTLETSLNESNNKVRHLNKSVRINNAKLKQHNLQPSLEANETPTPPEKHPYGIKTNEKYCQECWDLGMKKRTHKGKCDPIRRAQALARKQESIRLKAERQANAKSGGQPQEKGKTKTKNKPGTTNAVRKHPLNTYKE